MELELLKKTMIFRGMSEDEISSALHSLNAAERNYRKGEAVFFAGTTTRKMGLVLSGSVTIESNDRWGNRSILSHVGPGQFFAETYALLPDTPMLVDVFANEDSRILFFRVNDLCRTPVLPEETWRIRFITNLLSVSSHKNLTLSSRNFHTAPKTIRGRVMAYLNTVSLQMHSSRFEIPFDRQQLADYLNVERTALSKELGKMQKDGLITVKKNQFEIHSSEE